MRKWLLILSLLSAFVVKTLAQNKTFDSLEALVKTAKQDSITFKAYQGLASSFSIKNFDSNLYYARQGLAFAFGRKDALQAGIFNNHIGAAWYFKGTFDSAAFYYYKSASLLQKINALPNLAATYNNLAKLYRKTGDYPRALSFYNKAITIYENMKDYDNLSSMYNEEGVVYEYQTRFADALANYNTALELKKRLKDSAGIAYALSFIAGVYNQQSTYSQAKDFALQALSIRQRIKDSFPIALSYSDLGDIYQSLGDYAKSKESYIASNDYIRTMHYPDFLSSNLKQLSEVANKQQDYKAAFEYYKQYSSLKDSVFRIQSAKQVEELSDKYETAEKEETIQQQKFQISKRNYYIAGILLVLLLGSLLGYSAYRRYRLKQQAKLQAEILHQQDLAAKAVITAEETERVRIAGELHDGIGQMMSAAKMNLSSIEDEIPFISEEQKNRFDKVVALIDESCNEVRAVSHNMMPNALLKTGLAMAVREFIDKIDKKVIYISLHAEGLNEKIDANVETVLYRVIQECVNNVIKHSGANRLDIALIRDTEGISATIEDNGRGFDAARAKDFEGIGLKNIKSRVAYLKGTVEWDSAEGRGTLVAVHVPVG